VAAAALSSVLSPIVGRVSDRRGARLLLVTGLGASAVLVSTLVLPHTAAVLAPLSVIALGGPLAAYMIPAVSMMTLSAEAAGVALVVVTTLGNLAYAMGETIGAPVAAGLSQATSDAVPILLLAALMLATLWPVSRIRGARPGATRQPATGQPSTGSSVTSRATSAA